MIEANRVKYLRIVLRVVALVFFGLFPLTLVWPSGWIWHTGWPDTSPYPPMIFGIYATLGVFLIVASRDPLAHRSLIWFTVWSSLVHGGIMAVQSVVDRTQIGHLWGDVLGLFGAAVALALLMPRSEATGRPRAA